MGFCGNIAAVMPNWLSRDPSEENGGVNLYGFVSNDPLSAFDAQGLALMQYSTDTSSLRFQTFDLRGKYNIPNLAARTDAQWPISQVATASGKTVAIQGSLNIVLQIQPGEDPNDPSSTADGLTITAHEHLHAELAKTLWNADLASVNKWEGTYCSEQCATLAASIANYQDLYNFYDERQQNLQIDVRQYNGANAKRGVGVAGQLKAAAQSGLDQATAAFSAAKCSNPN